MKCFGYVFVLSVFNMWIMALPHFMPMDISVLCELGHQGWWKFTMYKIIHKCSQLEPRNILKFQNVQLFEQRTSMFIIFLITYVCNAFI